MSSYQLEIDATGAESGSRRIVKSFEDIKAAAAKMEQGASSSFSKMAEAFKLLNNMRAVRSETLRSFREFSSAISGFRGPSAATMENTRKFFNMLGGLSGFRAPSGSGLRGLLDPLAGYKGPSAAAAKNTRDLLRAFNGFSPPRINGGFTSFLASLSSFRGPPPTAGRNTISFLNALSGFTAPKGISAAVRQFSLLADSLERAGRAMSGVRGGSITMPRAPSARDIASVREFGKGFGSLETAVLRTQTAINSLGGILGVKFLADASNQVVRIKAQLEAATGSVQQARVQFAFVTEQANKMGLEFTTVAKSYGMLLGSIKGTNVTFDEAQQIFMGFSTAARALQLSTDDVDGVFRALGQIMSKGKLQAEELRGQLGDRLPGAFVRFAKALDMTKPGQLDDALKKGAISGDKLKKAILEVANTMEAEFAVSADKASKTVDSAFNRLKNSFTFSAAEFGQNGFNQALINMADAMRKFLESDAFNTAMFGIAKILKLVSDNIELVASVAAGIGVASFAKWAVGIMGAGKALTGLNTVIKVFSAWNMGATAMQMAAGMGSIGTAAAGASRAMIGLRTVMMTMGWGLLIAAVTAAVYIFSQWKSKVDLANEAVQQHTKDTGELQNIYDAYIAKIHDSTGALDGEIAKTRELTLERLRAAQAALGDAAPVRFTSRSEEYSKGLKGRAASEAAAGGGFGDWWNNDVIPKDERQIVGRLVNKRGLPLAIHTDQDAVRLARSLASANVARTVKPLSEPGEKAFQQAQASWNIYRQQQRMLGNKNLDKLLGESFGDYNKSTQPPGISGDVPEKPKKDSGAAAFGNDIDRAVRAFRELDEKIKGTQASLRGFLTSSTSALAAQARAVATDKVSDLENGFEPAKRVSGIMAVAKALGLEADSYEAAKEALIGKYAAQEERQQRAQNDLNVGKTIAELREENRVRADHLLSITQGGDALNKANIAMQVEKELLNGSAENRAVLTQRLTEQLEIQQKLNQAEEVAAAIRDARLEADNNSSALRGYGMGLNPTELDRYRELTTYMNEMQSKGYDSGTLKFLESLKRAQQGAAAALKEVADQYEKLRQMSQDQADALVDSLRGVFEEGYTEGKKFFDRVGDLFKNLKGIILDFVLYNPLREWLTNSLQGFNTKAFGDGSAQSKATDAQSILREVQDQGRELLDKISEQFGSDSNFGVATTNLDNSATNLTSAATDLTNAAAALSGGSPAGLPGAATAVAGGDSQGFAALVAEYSKGPVGGLVAGVTNSITNMGDDLADSNKEIVVTATRAVAPVADREKKDYFAPLKKIFDYKTNFGDLKGGIKDIGSIFKSGGSFGSKLDKLGAGIGKVAGVAGKAFAAFEMGSGVGKMLGLGKGGSNILGGAAAGFSVGGPIGAAVGAVAGGIMSLFSKSPRAGASVVVGSDGRAGVGSSYAKSGGNREEAMGMASGGASIFNRMAEQLGSYLTAGNYGTFGSSKKIKGDTKTFYSVTGRVDKKGRPVGVAGVDYIIGNEDQMSTFALKSQMKSGKFGNLDPVYETIARNSGATGMDDFSSDLNVGKNYIDFIDAAKKGSELQKQVDALNKAFTSLKRSAGSLGLDTAKLTRAYDQQMKIMKEAFNYDISQQILQIKDPLLAAYNDLMKDYENAVGNAQAVGGDLASVEELYGLKRKKLLEDYMDQANNGISKAAQDLLTSLTASSNSPLSAQKTFNNAATDYNRLKGEISAGDYSNVDDLQTYVQNYLDAARTMYRSGGDYFDIFGDVTAFLKSIEEGKIGQGPTTPEDLPVLPGVDAIIEKLSHQNDDLLGVNQAIGAAIVNGNASNEELLTNILDALRQYGGYSGDISGTGLVSYGLASRVSV